MSTQSKASKALVLLIVNYSTTSGLNALTVIILESTAESPW